MTGANLEAKSTLLWLPEGPSPAQTPLQMHPHTHAKGHSEWPLFYSWESTTQPSCLRHNRKCNLGATSENKWAQWGCQQQEGASFNWN